MSACWRRCVCFAAVVAVFLALQSCVRDETKAVADVDPRGFDDGVSVFYVNEDTVSLRNIGVIVRTDRSFAPGPLQMEIETFSPDSLVLSERLTVVIPARTGDGINDAYAETVAPYRSGVVLKRRGEYRFTLTPVGAGAGVRGVAGIGLDITYGKK